METPNVRSMEEFASLSGVSRPTVSKYFHDPSSVRKSTRERIERALERYDYRPNIFATNLNRKLTKTIGVMVPYLADPFFAEMARRIEQRCLEAGYWPIVFSAHGRGDLECDVLDTIRSLKPAGALLAPLGRGSDRGVIEAFCREVPCILFDSDLAGLGEGFIGSNTAQSVPMIVDYLCRTGEPPAFFEMTPINPNAAKRSAAYRDAMERLGQEPAIVHIEREDWDFERVGFEEGVRLIESRSLRTNTVLCSNDRLAIGFLAACYEKGLRVGRGSGCAMRVAGHDDHPTARFTCPPLTTVAQDYSAISDTSAEALFALIEGGAAPASRETLFDGKLIMRASA